MLPATSDPQAQTLTAQSLVLGGTLAASGTPEIAAPIPVNLFETSGNSGQYAYSYPLAVAPGTGGVAPQLALSYSSQATDETRNTDERFECIGIVRNDV